MFPSPFGEADLERVRCGTLTQSGFQATIRHHSKDEAISNQKLTKKPISNPYSVRHRHQSTKTIGFQRFSEWCRFFFGTDLPIQFSWFGKGHIHDIIVVSRNCQALWRGKMARCRGI